MAKRPSLRSPATRTSASRSGAPVNASVSTLPSSHPDGPPLSRDSEERVGYANPPRHSRFQKGKSGNPHGRPKGSKNLDTLLAQLLAQPITVTMDGRQRRMPTVAIIVRRLLERAMKGELRAIALILKHQGAAMSGPTAPTHNGAAPSMELDDEDEAIVAAFLSNVRAGAAV